MSNVTEADVTTRLTALTQRLKEVKVAFDAGAVIDLGGLDKEIAAVCRQAQTLGADASAEMRDAMRGLMDMLDALQSDLAQQYGQMSDSMGGLNVRRQAAAAYGKANTRS